jgi:hypothetical protein
MANRKKSQDTHKQERSRKTSRPKQSGWGSGRSKSDEPGAVSEREGEREEGNPGGEDGSRGQGGASQRSQEE